jgi:hypothetical protein
MPDLDSGVLNGLAGSRVEYRQSKVERQAGTIFRDALAVDSAIEIIGTFGEFDVQGTAGAGRWFGDQRLRAGESPRSETSKAGESEIAAGKAIRGACHIYDPSETDGRKANV